MNNNAAEFKSLEIVMEIDIHATVETVWAALTSELPTWWPRDFHIGGEASTLTFDPTPGGLMKESWPGGGLVWGQVLAVVENELLQTAGDLFPEYGGPARGHITYKLEATDGGTKLRFVDVTWGRVSDEMESSKRQGWEYLLEQTMKPWCEARG